MLNLSALALILCAGIPAAHAQAVGSVFSVDTEPDFNKSNQSKVFYHDGKWWALALFAEESDWYIWQFDANSNVWSHTVLVHTSSSRRPDALLDAASNRLYVFLSNSSKSEINRYTYSGGTWVLDSGFPVNLTDFPDGGTTNPIGIVRAKNGSLWVFRMTSNRLEAKKSANSGSTWTSIITVKTGLTTSTGTADAIAFTNASAENNIGVAYAETDVAGSRFGFLVHRDSDADNVWSDETNSLTFSAGERATNELSLTVDNGNNVLMLTRNANASGSAPRNTLYKRNSAGTWQSFAVNTSTTWMSPALAVGNGNNTLYVIGVNTANARGEYKSCILGQEASLATTAPTVLFTNGTSSDDFADLSVPAPGNFGSVTQLMVCASNQDDEFIWYNRIPFSGGSASLAVGNITASPNEANTAAAYTIPITLGSTGALAAGSGTISIQFPDNTFVPASVTASAVTVNGTAATTVVANSATREVTVTTPINLSNSAAVSIVFNLAAGLLNPSLSGNKTLAVWTSTELTPVASPNYSISPATTSVSVATVTPNPIMTNTAAAYVITFNLGAHGRLIAGSSTITITFNSATTVSNGSISGAQINGVAASATGNSAAKTIVLTVPASVNLANGAAVTINLPSSAITNPAVAGNYTLTVATNVETGPTTSNLYVISSGTPLSIGTISLSTQEANANPSYTIPLTLGNSGALSAGSGTITVQFPNNTFVPGTIGTNQVTVGGVAASAVTANSSTREVTITVPNNLANGASVNIVFNTGAGLLNPSNAGNYSLQAWSSAEPAHAVSPAYAITAATTAVTAAIVTPNPTTANLASAYTILFNLGAHGRLIAGSSTVTITFNNATTVSNGNINGAQINSLAASATGNSAAKTIVLTIPASLNLANNAAVTINLPSTAITNPASSANYTLTVATSVETAPTTSNAYTISPPTPLAVGTVSISDHEANATASYTIPLTLGSNGALNAGSGTITILFPNNTSVPGSISNSQVTVNGVAANNVVSNSGTREVSVTVPSSLSGAANVSLVFGAAAGLMNPSPAGNYSLQAWSSVEPAHIASPLYAIHAATTTTTPANVTPSPNTASSAAAYDIAFNLGARGRLLAGSSTITVAFNSSTVVSNGSLSGAQINGVNATATGNSGSKIVTLTIPASLNLANNAAVTVHLASSSITNPANGGFYTVTITTSVEPANVISQAYVIVGNEPPPPGDASAIAGTGGDYDKPHQSRVFYHDAKWWLTALKKSDNTWKLWKFDGTDWIEQLQVADSRASRPDCFVDNANNKLYIFVSHNSQSRFLRLSYNAGAWSMDGGYPVNVPSFTHSGEYSISFSRAKNGELWAFRASGGQLVGIVSVNEGQSWSGVINIKSLNNESLTDCHAFSTSSGDFMGVCYSENSTDNSVAGFLRHQDGASQSSWTDESSLLPPYSGTQSDDHINIAVADNGIVYLITKTDGGGNTIVDNGLYKRATGGTWQLFAVNRGGGWTRPALGIDQSNSQLYAFGTPEGSNKLGYLKRVAMGSESSLENATELTVIQGGSNSFVNLSVAQNNHTTTSGMMVTVENDVDEQVWYNLLDLGSDGGSSPTPLVVNSVVANPNTAAINAAYTIGLTLGSQGALNAGSGTITVTWPTGTTIPASILTTAVTINGNNASAITTNPANRRAVITVPNNLANSAAVTLVFSASAGLLNPGSGNHTLQAQTSTQPTDVTSPNYSIQAVTSVTVSNVTVTPNAMGQTAAYTIPITLGSSGALAGGNGTITVTWPNGTGVPASIANTNATVNGSNAAAVSANSGSRQAIVTVPSSLPNSASVTLAFTAGAGIANPAVSGNYALQVQTSAQPVNGNSPNYTITSGGSSLTVGTITTTPDTVNRTASYLIPITLGSSGALTGGSGTITVTWPFNTQVPASINAAHVTINGSAANNVTSTPGTRQATVTVPVNLANNANATVLFSNSAGLTNPSTDGNYALQVHTSAEPADASSPNYNIKPVAPPSNPFGASVAATTDATLEKPNQSKLFYFQDKWWLIAYDSVKTDWHLWKFASGAWTRGLKVDGRIPVRIDAVLDSANSRLYYVSSHSTTTQVGRLLYNGTGWSQELALVTVAGFGHGSTVNAVSIARAHNGQLWLFRINGTALEAKVSADNGQTWSATLTLKSGITGNGGSTDALAFTANGNRVGVFYGMSSGNGGVAYGFLHHLDGTANNSWTDESASLTFFANERGNNLINALAAKDGRLFLVTRNSKVGAANAVQNTLYLRTNAGAWSKHKVNVGSNAWKSPILALDESNDRLYVAGIRTAAPNYAEYKSCTFGNESTLETQTATAFLQHNNDNFGELTAPAHVVYENENLMLCGGNATTNDVWYKEIELGLAKQVDTPRPESQLAAEDGPEVGAYPNPFNPATTIRFRIKEANSVRLRIFSLRGELVRTLVDQEMSPGVHERRWNGKDRNGQLVASGVYFYRLEIGGRIHQGRLQMVK